MQASASPCISVLSLFSLLSTGWQASWRQVIRERYLASASSIHRLQDPCKSVWGNTFAACIASCASSWWCIGSDQLSLTRLLIAVRFCWGCTARKGDCRESLVRYTVPFLFLVQTDMEAELLTGVQHILFRADHQHGCQTDVWREICIFDGYHGIVPTNCWNFNRVLSSCVISFHLLLSCHYLANMV